MPAPHAPQHLIGDGRRMRHVYARTCPVFLHFVQRDECLSLLFQAGNIEQEQEQEQWQEGEE